MNLVAVRLHERGIEICDKFNRLARCSFGVEKLKPLLRMGLVRGQCPPYWRDWTVRAALGSVHGIGKIDAGLSDFYLVDEIQGTYRGMMMAIPAPHWQVFGTCSDDQMVLVLQQLAGDVELKRFLKATRGVKKKRPPLIVNSQQRHLSTARLLETYQTLMKSGVRK